MKQMTGFWMVFLLVGSLTMGPLACWGDDPGGFRDSGSQIDEGSDADSGVEPDGTLPEDGGDDDVGGDDIGDDDVGDDDVGSDVEDEPDACVPSMTECSEDSCGQVDNGCGEMLDCGECPCESGTVQKVKCGTCGLGERTCGADETGVGSCVAPDVPGVSEDVDDGTCETRLIFVDGSAVADGDGSRTAPLKKYSDAVASADAGDVIILGGQATFEEQLSVKKRISVLGGFSSAPEFQWSASRRATFEVAAPDDDDVIGVEALDIDQDTVLAQVEVTTADAADGRTNYGAYVRDSTQLTMKDVEVRAGHGGNGADGGDGEAGADGEAGEDSVQHRGGGGGAGTNGACPEADGGAAGVGSKRVSTILQTPDDGEDAASGAAGGEAGDGGLSDSSKAGADGENGLTPSRGGDSGDYGVSGGVVVDDRWIPEGAGGDGADGPHGPGGAGGGGAWHGPEYQDTQIYYDGPEGGAGGAGGCGGEGGAGGGPGAGSFGLFLVRSDVTLNNSTFEGGAGGIGGSGGSGGLGGSGAPGGRGTDSTRTGTQINGQFYYTTLDWSSGDGGDGADGREGGHGGGGAGGVSYGAYCVESQPAVEGATEFVAGSSASGGQSPGSQGLDGISEDSHQCE